jgi:outer membrane protein assembly factor BamB
MSLRWRSLVFLRAVAASLALLAGAGFSSWQTPPRSQAPQPQPSAAPPEDLAKQLVVMIRGKLADVDVIGAGIIFGIDQDRIYVVTANHVVRQGPQTAVTGLQVLFKWLPGEWTEARLLSDFDADLDVAVIAVPGARSLILNRRLMFDRLGGEPQRKDQVYTVGYPSGQQWFSRVTADVVSGTTSDLVTFETTFLQPGSSGGALVNGNWEILGLVKQDQPPNGVAVRMDRVVEKLKQWGYVNRLTLRAGSPTNPSGGTADPPRGAPGGTTDPGRGATGDPTPLALSNRFGWPMFGRDEFHSNTNRDESTLRPPLRPLARLVAREMTSIQSLTAAEGWLFASGSGQTGRNSVTGINLVTRARWTYALAGVDAMDVAPAFTGKLLYVGGQQDDKLYGLEYTTGSVSVQLPGASSLYSRHPTYRNRDQTLFYATPTALVALDVPTNRPRRTYPMRASQSSPFACGTGMMVLERTAARDVATMHMIAADGSLARSYDVPTTSIAYPTCYERLPQSVRPRWTIAVRSGAEVSAYDIVSDQPVWRTRLTGDATALPGESKFGFANGVLLAPLWTAQAGNGFVYALDGDSGRVLWRFSTGAPGIRGPAIANGVVYITGWQSRKVFALDLKDGRELWSAELHASPSGDPIVAYGYLYLPVGNVIYVFGT